MHELLYHFIRVHYMEILAVLPVVLLITALLLMAAMIAVTTYAMIMHLTPGLA